MNDLRNKDTLKARKVHGNTLAYLQRNRGKPQYRHAPSAGRAANKVLRPLSRKFGPGVSSLRSQWPQIIGDRWAALSIPTAVRGRTGAKTLHIEVKGPAAAMLLADSAYILDRVNQYLGKGAISKIAVKQGRIKVKSRPIATDVKRDETHMRKSQEIDDNIDDKSLKALLDAFEAKIKAKNT